MRHEGNENEDNTENYRDSYWTVKTLTCNGDWSAKICRCRKWMGELKTHRNVGTKMVLVTRLGRLTGIWRTWQGLEIYQIDHRRQVFAKALSFNRLFKIEWKWYANESNDNLVCPFWRVSSNCITMFDGERSVRSSARYLFSYCCKSSALGSGEEECHHSVINQVLGKGRVLGNLVMGM